LSTPWTDVSGGVRVMVHARTKAKGPYVPTLMVDAEGRSLLALSVRSAPVEGAANDEFIRLLAQMAGVAPSRISLEAGTQAKVKRFHITGDAPAIMAALAQAVEQ